METIRASMQVDGGIPATASLDVGLDVPAVTECSDFTKAPNAWNGFLPPNVSSGVHWRMKPKTSTKAALIAKILAGDPNPYSLIKFGSDSATKRTAGIDVAGFLVEGTDQGHLYNGLRIGASLNAHVHDGYITGIPGNSSGPPGETFSFASWEANGLLVENVHVDGLSIAATLFGINSSIDVKLLKCWAQGTKVAFGLASWKCGDVLVQDFDVRNNRRPINIEQPAGPHTLERCDMRGMTSRPHITCNSNQRSVPLLVIDPEWDTAKGPLRIGVDVSGKPYFGLPQLQKIADVQVKIGGKDVTKDTSKVLIGNVW